MTQRLYMGSGILCCMLKMKTKSNTDRQFLCQFRLLPHTQLSHIQINIQEVSLSSCYQKNYPGGQLNFIVITLHGLQSLLNCTTCDRFASKPHLNTITVMWKVVFAAESVMPILTPVFDDYAAKCQISFVNYFWALIPSTDSGAWTQVLWLKNCSNDHCLLSITFQHQNIIRELRTSQTF